MRQIDTPAVHLRHEYKFTVHLRLKYKLTVHLRPYVLNEQPTLTRTELGGGVPIPDTMELVRSMTGAKLKSQH